VLGDFNIAPEDRDVHDPAAWAGQVLCSAVERPRSGACWTGACRTLSDCSRTKKTTFSWWDYRAAAFRRNLGLRIDHILISPALAATCTACGWTKLRAGWSARPIMPR
jgi:exodeoxyribonuclease-3